MNALDVFRDRDVRRAIRRLPSSPAGSLRHRLLAHYVLARARRAAVAHSTAAA